MKISIVYNDRFPSRIAHGVYLAKLCSSLADTGAEVELIVPKRFNEIPGDPFSFYDIKNNFKIIKIWSFDFIIFAKLQPRFFYWLQYLNFYFFLFFYMSFRSRNRVIYTMDYMGPSLKLLGYKVVFESHGGLEGGASFFIPFILRSNFIVGTNSFIVNKFVGLGYPKDKTLVAPNGVDLEKFEIMENVVDIRKKLGLPLDKKIVSYIGKFKTMGKGKGVEELIEAFARIILSRPDAYLMIVGVSENEKKDLENILKNHRIEDHNYKLVLQVLQSDIPNYLKVSDALIMNYPKKEHYEYFMSPMKMFEYMASGRPIISTDLPSVREVLNENNAVLVEAENTDSLVNGVLKVLNDDNLARKISEQAREDVKQYAWDRRAEKILKLISS